MIVTGAEFADTVEVWMTYSLLPKAPASQHN